MLHLRYGVLAQVILLNILLAGMPIRPGGATNNPTGKGLSSPNPRVLPSPTPAPPPRAYLSALAECSGGIADADIVRRSSGDGDFAYWLRVRQWLKRPADVIDGTIVFVQGHRPYSPHEPLVDISDRTDHWILLIGTIGTHDWNLFRGIQGAYGIQNSIVISEDSYLWCGNSENLQPPISYHGWSVTRFLATVRAAMQPTALPPSGRTAPAFPAVVFLIALATFLLGVLLRHRARAGLRRKIAR